MSFDPPATQDLEMLLEHLVAGVAVHDPTGVVIRVNPMACRLMGLPASDMLGRGLHDPTWRLRRDDGSEMPVDEYPASRVLRTGAPVSNQTVGVIHPGSVTVDIWVLCNAYLERAPSGAVRRVVVMLLDITERVATERALAESESRFRLLYENSQDGMLMVRQSGEVFAANPAACRMFGMHERELVGRHAFTLVDTQDPRAQPLLRPPGGPRRATGPVRLLPGDGPPFEADLSVVDYAAADGSPVTSVVVRDLSLQRKAEAAEAARDLAERANREKSAFVAKVSHELRTPLNAVLGLTSLALEQEGADAPPQARERLRLVSDAAQHLLRLIDDLLDLSAAEMGKLVVHPASVDAAALVEGLVEQIGGMAAERRVRIEVDPPPGPLHAFVDPGRLSQVLWNLLSNAIKYNRDGGRVDVRVRAHDGRCEIAVRDDGVGMTAQQVDALFQPFERLGRERSKVPGMGIGLAVTHHLVDLMHGRIRVSSVPGRGSEFVVDVPLAEGSTSPEPASPVQPAAPAPAHRPLVLLYVDDHAVNRMVMQGMASLEPGWQLREADSGPAALEDARHHPPDIVLIDLMMPGMDGWTLLDALRADPALRHTPCVAVSGNAFADDIARARAHGFDGYVTKPVLLEPLRREVRRVMAAAR